MRVISRGIPESQKEYRATCMHCHSTVEFVQPEGKITGDQRDGDFVSVDCPVCDHKIHVAK